MTRSKILWYLLYPLYLSVVLYANGTQYRAGGLKYWWGVVKDMHQKDHGSLTKKG